MFVIRESSLATQLDSHIPYQITMPYQWSLATSLNFPRRLLLRQRPLLEQSAQQEHHLGHRLTFSLLCSSGLQLWLGNLLDMTNRSLSNVRFVFFLACYFVEPVYVIA